MTHDKAMEMAREFGDWFLRDSGWILNCSISDLATLILRIDTEARQQQREADARVCDKVADSVAHQPHKWAARECAAAIREGGR